MARSLHLVAAAALIVALGGCGGGGPPDRVAAPTATANLWVAAGAGACTRQSTAVDFAQSATDGDARCGALDTAQDAAKGGDVVRIQNGTYPAQDITGPKSSTVTYIGESKKGVRFTGLVNLEDFVELRNVTAENDAHSNVPQSVAADGYDHVTLRNVDALGDYVTFSLWGSTNFLWEGGRLGDFDGSIQKRWCGRDQVPLYIGKGANHIVVDGVRFSDSRPSEDGENGCSGDNVHLEEWRMDGSANDIIMRRNVMEPNGSNSACVFMANLGGSPTNVKIVGNVIGPCSNVSISGQAQDCSSWLIAYNTLRGHIGTWNCAVSGETFVGNLTGVMPGGDPTCANATFVSNVFEAGSDPGCNGGDDHDNTWVPGADYETGKLGISADGHLEAGSPAIDAAETPGAHDVCTDTSIMGKLGDIDGDPRPSGSRCDAGADEHTPG